MLTTINVHSRITAATAGDTVGAPLTISGERLWTAQDQAQTEVTFFVRDHDLARKLSIAINTTIQDHRASVALLEAAE